jgi:hopanoid biosynthesis associated protein HpnK
MVNEPWAEQAVGIAKKLPALGVGLHLSLVCGKTGLNSGQIPSITRDDAFLEDPVRAGLKFFFSPKARAEVVLEIREQFRRFKQTGLIFDHVNGHLNIHMHPAVFPELVRCAADAGAPAIRLTNDPLLLNLSLSRGAYAYRLSHWFIYSLLSRWCKKALLTAGFAFTDQVFGLLQNGRVNEEFLLKLLAQIPAGTAEVYSHPSLSVFAHEYQALISPAVKRKVVDCGITLCRYQDLASPLGEKRSTHPITRTHFV